MPRVLYADEAGIGNPSHEPFLVVAGLLVHLDTQLNKLYAALEDVGNLMPDRCREQGLILHPSHVYGGNGKFDERRFPEWVGKRMPILEALAEIPRRANIQIVTGIVDRSKFTWRGLLVPANSKTREIKSNQTVAAHAMAYMACLLEADVWLRKNKKNENCMVIAEDNNEARAAIKYLHRYHQRNMPLEPDLQDAFPLRRIREDPAFQEKLPDHPLILADFVAFIIKRAAMKDARSFALMKPWRDRVVSVSAKTIESLRD